jgi:hypothetical protein
MAHIKNNIGHNGAYLKEKWYVFLLAQKLKPP